MIQHGGKKWRAIAAAIPLRSPVQCNARWNELQSLHTAVKTPWTPHEDERMAQLVTSYGPGRWAVIASFLPGRNGKQCRERCVRANGVVYGWAISLVLVGTEQVTSCMLLICCSTYVSRSR